MRAHPRVMPASIISSLVPSEKPPSGTPHSLPLSVPHKPWGTCLHFFHECICYVSYTLKSSSPSPLSAHNVI